MKSLISFIALIWLALADPTMSSKNGFLDPGRITWWQDKWAPNPIELTQTNSGNSNVYVIVHFRPFTSVNSDGNSGILQLIVPSSFSSTGTYTSSSMTITGGTDMTAQFQLSTSLPSAGVYGPFQLITRSSSTGQIYDTNYVFGCVAVSASVSSSSSLTISAATLTSTTGIVGSKDALIFSFSIPAGTNLWKHDIFEIVPDSHWTVSTSPTCASVDISTVTNSIKGPKGDNSLPCAVAASGGANGGFSTAASTATPATNSVYIYGLSQDVIINSSYQIKLQVSSFTFPSSAVSSSSYSWTLKLWRWGTTNLLAQYTGSGPLTPATGSITVTSWAPYNSNVASTDIPSTNSNNFSIFTKLTFQIAHPISSGTIAITFSNADISTSNWFQEPKTNSGTAGKCFLNNYVSGVTCSVSSSTATISISGATLAASSSISITLLTALSSGAKVSSIISNDGTANIDTLATGFSWTFSSASSYASMTSFKFYATDQNKYLGSTGLTSGIQKGGYLATTQYLLWYVQPSTSWGTGSTLKVYLPFSNSGVQLTQTFIKSTAAYSDLTFADNTQDQTLLTTNGNTATPTSGSSGSISIAFASTNAPVPGTSPYFAFSYGDPSGGSDSKTTALPFVQSNVATFYECWAKGFSSSSSSTAVEFSSYVFSVYNSQSDSLLTATPMCTDTFAGIPLIVNYHALNLAFNFGDTTNHYSLDISFSGVSSNNLGSGVTDGNAFPVTSTSSSITPSATITSNKVTISGLGSVSSGSSVVLLLPNGLPTGPIAATLTFYYVPAGSDPSIQYVLYTGSSSTSLNSASSAAGYDSSSVTSPTSYTVGGSAATTTGSVKVHTGASVSASDWIGIGLPAGFTLSSSGYSVTLGGVSSTAYTVSSSSNSFTGGFIVGTAASAITLSTSTASTFTIGNLIPSSTTGTTSNSNSVSLVVYSASAASTPAACYAIGSISVTLSAATITSDTCSLDKAYTQGSDSVDSTLTLSFTTVNAIPGNGIITLTLSSSTWTTSSSAVATTCEGVGFTNYSNSVSKSCTISGTTVTLTGFASVAAGVITVKIYHIIPTTTTAGSITCFSAVSTSDGSGNYIDTLGVAANSVTLTATSAAGTTNSGLVAKAYPNIAGATSDIYLSFSFSKAIPAGSIIQINPGFVSSWALSSSTIQNSCWTDQYTSSCSVSGSYVSLTLGNSLAASQAIQVYLDSALTLPTSNSTTSGWTISTTWNGVSITADSTSGSTATFPFVIGTAVSNVITLASIVQVNTTSAGEVSSYLFTFSSASAVATTDSFIIQFPKDFDPHVGDAKAVLNDCSPNNFYLTCGSSALGIPSGTLCSADHWYVVVTGITKTLAASASIDIQVNMVQNPVAGTTAGKFSFYQYGSDGSVKSYLQSASTVTIGSNVANIVSLKNVTVDSTELANSATYTFNFYAAATYTPDYIISILFPQQFNNQLKMGTSSSCKSVYYDESSSSTSTTTSTAFSSATSCSVNGNNVTLAFPSGTSLAMASTSRIQVQLTSFYNPEWGFTRTAGWDVTDYATFTGTTSPDEWSNKFDIAVSQFSTGKTYARSYGVLHSGFIGYTLSTTDLSIGNYDPTNTSGGIKLLPGQQSSDITISLLDSNSWPMKSKSLKLSPTSNANYPDNGNLKYTSAQYSFIAFQMVSQIKFRVSATSSAAQGIYYIDWGTPVETLQDGVSSPLYSAPLNILVEVCSSLTAVSITVDPLPSIYQYYTSLPIRVALANSPATQLIVTPSASVTGFTITPTALTFGPDVNELYFQIHVGSTYVASTTSPSLTFTLSGTDAAAFTAPSKVTVSVLTTYPSIVAATPGLSGSKVSASEYKISVTTSIAGVLYWGLGCQGSQVLTFAGLSALVSDLVTPSSSILTLNEQLAIQYNHTETDINTSKGDTDIYSFFKRIHAEHCNDYWASSQVITTSGATLDFNWLMAGTSYTFTAYIATRLTNDTTVYPIKTYNFTTDALASIYTTSVTFSGSVASSSSSNIAKVLAKNMGVNPSWLTLSGTSSSRMLQSSTTSTTTFTYNVLADSRYPSYTSSSMITNLNTNQAQATSDFTNLYALTATSLGTSASVSTGTTPSWSTAPAKSTVADTSATFTAASSQAGTIYVSCSDDDLTGRITYAWQVMDGLDATSSTVPSSSVTSVAATSETLTVAGLKAGTAYVCYFTACNSYPLNPLCIDYVASTSTALASVSITTTGSSSSSSNAVFMEVSAALTFFLILLN
ncbi:unnamed protein product [Blepharisma stoltei]|uniref:Uncharacterized protein n=1 Tax=Blepharisma stoltei TaxID=1481888 RepID=A0AAU9IF97_9CILI|nr:unnamed protein product [Blepharisma stoltei]